MNINETAHKAHANARNKGFWDKRLTVPQAMAERGIFSGDEIDAVKNAFTAQSLMLITSELGEALEANRKGKHCDQFSDENKAFILEELSDEEFKQVFEARIKDTLSDELADAVIRILDFAGGEGIDLEFHIAAKMKYNTLREAMHGKKY